ncbi:MAG: Uma2 family endonuclease [Synechococcales cyanobacterium CRU_2_2]|nr:Uma2 family endonuclease [Synechococcales cyanobacterium CRU_2_2]
MTAITLQLEPLTLLTREAFVTLCEANPDAQLERTPDGELVIMSPVGGGSGKREASLIVQVGSWNERAGLGEVFSSSTIFSLSGGGDRSPDVAWVRQDRWDALTVEEQEGFPPICPDFVIELRSRTDRLKPLQAKMLEYLDSGLQLGLLINPQDRQVELYGAEQPMQVLEAPLSVVLGPLMPGLELDLRSIW